MVLALVALAAGAEAAGRVATERLAQMQVRPTSGPAGTQIDVRARGLWTQGVCRRQLEFTDAAGAVLSLGFLPFTDSFRTNATIPVNATPGLGTVYVQTYVWTPEPVYCDPTIRDVYARAPFTVVGGSRSLAVRSAQMQVRPTSGPAGTGVEVMGLAARVHCGLVGIVAFSFVDSLGTVTSLGWTIAGTEYKTSVTVPADAAPGGGVTRATESIPAHGLCWTVTVGLASFLVISAPS
jgi:hypothetical protein